MNSPKPTIIPYAISEVKTENITSGDTSRTPRQYFTVRFRSSDAWSQATGSRTIWSDVKSGEQDWKGLTPDLVKQFVDKKQPVPGKIKTWDVEDYDIDGRTANTFSGVVLGERELEHEAAYEQGKSLSSLTLKAYGRNPRFVHQVVQAPAVEAPFDATPVNPPSIPV